MTGNQKLGTFLHSAESSQCELGIDRGVDLLFGLGVWRRGAIGPGVGLK